VWINLFDRFLSNRSDAGMEAAPVRQFNGSTDLTDGLRAHTKFLHHCPH
jgi:hypothetical protein